MTESHPTQSTPAGPTRRQVLRGGAAAAVGVGAAVTLSACAGGSEGDGGNEEPISTGNPQTVPKDSVPVGNGLILEEDYVVTQPTEGDFKAFTKACPHQGCNVSLIRDGSIVCACHTSLFSVNDGSLTSGPARRGLSPVKVEDDGDNLLVG